MPPITTETEKKPSLQLSRIYRRIVITHIVGLLGYIFLLFFAITQMPEAARIGDYATINVLTVLGFSADSCDWDSEVSPLMQAAGEGHTDIAELLLERGAEVNAEDGCGNWTPLHYAAHAGNLKMARLLLAHGADVNSVRCSSATPLITSITSGSGGQLEMVKLLIAHGAAPAQRDNDRHDARYYAEFNGHIDVLRYLKHLPNQRGVTR